MKDGAMSTSEILRLVGFMGVCVALAWLVQVLGFPPEGAKANELVWILGAAAISGASFGLIYTAKALAAADGLSLTAPRKVA